MLNAVSAAAFAACLVAITVLALECPRPPRLAPLCFLVVASFLLVNKVWSPQYSLWLVPLAVLAVPHRRLLLGWMTRRRPGLAGDDAELPRHRQQGPPHRLVPGHGARPRRGRRRAVRAGRAHGAPPGRDLVRATVGDDPDWPLTPARVEPALARPLPDPGPQDKQRPFEPASADRGVVRGHEAIASRPTVSRRRTPSSSTYGPTRNASSPR